MIWHLTLVALAIVVAVASYTLTFVVPTSSRSRCCNAAPLLQVTPIVGANICFKANSSNHDDVEHDALESSWWWWWWWWFDNSKAENWDQYEIIFCAARILIMQHARFSYSTRPISWWEALFSLSVYLIVLESFYDLHWLAQVNHDVCYWNYRSQKIVVAVVVYSMSTTETVVSLRHAQPEPTSFWRRQRWVRGGGGGGKFTEHHLLLFGQLYCHLSPVFVVLRA